MVCYGLTFNMKILIFDPHFQVDNLDVQQVEFDSLLKSADVIFLHVPLYSETVRMIGSSEFSL
jgi:phosphoglycerate dehydrogenase-like enzyme